MAKAMTPNTNKELPKKPHNELLQMAETMLLIRRLEEEAARAYMEGKIGGFLHLYIGQEAIAVGAEAAIKPTDHVITTYRDHGFAIARGVTPGAVMAELYGKDTGCSRGLGGSMHMFDVSKRFMGGHAIVGGHLPLAAGMAFASKYQKKDEVTLCFFGDGATNIGAFHEGLALAAIWKLPCIFVCENNQYSMGTPLSRTMPTDFIARAAGYGMKSDKFSGHDVLLVKEKIAHAVSEVRKGSGPWLIEIETYRFRGHSMSDPGKYRTSDEVEREKKLHDPCQFALSQLKGLGIDTSEMEARVEEQVKAAVQFADESEPAKMESVLSYI